MKIHRGHKLNTVYTAKYRTNAFGQDAVAVHVTLDALNPLTQKLTIQAPFSFK